MAHQFGYHILDELFSRYAANVSRHLLKEKTKHNIFVISLKKKKRWRPDETTAGFAFLENTISSILEKYCMHIGSLYCKWRHFVDYRRFRLSIIHNETEGYIYNCNLRYLIVMYHMINMLLTSWTIHLMLHQHCLATMRQCWTLERVSRQSTIFSDIVVGLVWFLCLLGPASHLLC